jgi:hypothetical protein
MKAHNDDEKWLQEILPGYRDQLLRMGMPKDQVDGFVRLAWTQPQIHIESVEDYKRACILHEEMQKHVPKGDFLSPAAVRMHALGGEMIRFEEEYKEKHGGDLPDTM